MSATTWHYAISVATAVPAGACLAAAGVLQQRAASRRPSDESFSLRLVGGLVRDRTWLAGIAAAGLSYGFQAVALAFGPLALVQPLMVSEMLAAVPISIRRYGLRLRKRDWAAALVVVAGLAVGIVSADPKWGNPIQPIADWAPALGVVFVVTVLAVGVGKAVDGPARASVWAFGGAVVMGLQSATYAATVALLGDRVFGTFLTWEPYALVVVSLLGAFLIQNAFQAGPLAASTPVIDATLPLVAVGLGVGLFGEHVSTSPLAMAGEGVGIALAVAGIALLDTSPIVRREHRLERREREGELAEDGDVTAGTVSQE